MPALRRYSASRDIRSGKLVDPRVAHGREVELLRSQLPLRKYLFLLDQAVTTGYVPRTDQFGQPVTPDPDLDVISARERVDLATKLVAMSMPPLTAKELSAVQPPPTPTIQAGEAGTVVRNLSRHQLESIANPHRAHADTHPGDSPTTPCDAETGEDIPTPQDMHAANTNPFFPRA